MGFLDELKKLTKPYSDEDEEYDYVEEEEVEEEPQPQPRASRRTAPAPEPSFTAAPTENRRTSNSSNRVVNINATAQLQVVLVKPERFENVSEIADHLRERHAVMLNLEGTDRAIARRLVDFLSGCCYAVDGKIKKVAASAYLITPYNVEIVGDLVSKLEDNGVYF